MYFKPSFIVDGSTVMLTVSGDILLYCYMYVTTTVGFTLNSAVLHIQIKQTNLVIDNIYNEIKYYRS